MLCSVLQCVECCCVVLVNVVLCSVLQCAECCYVVLCSVVSVVMLCSTVW